MKVKITHKLTLYILSFIIIFKDRCKIVKLTLLNSFRTKDQSRASRLAKACCSCILRCAKGVVIGVASTQTNPT